MTIMPIYDAPIMLPIQMSGWFCMGIPHSFCKNGRRVPAVTFVWESGSDLYGGLAVICMGVAHLRVPARTSQARPYSAAASSSYPPFVWRAPWQ